MALTLVQLNALKTEIQNDPTTLNYAAPYAAGSDQAVADILNAVRGTITVKRSNIMVAELYAAISVADYTALPGNPTAAQLSTERRYLAWLSGLVALSRVRLLNEDGTDTPVMANLNQMFGAATASRARLTAAAQRTGSRAEQLFGTDVVVTADDVSNTRLG